MVGEIKARGEVWGGVLCFGVDAFGGLFCADIGNAW